MLTAADFANNAQDEAAILQLFSTNIAMISYSPAGNTAGVHTMSVVPGFNGNNSWIGRDWNGNLIDVNTVKNFPSVVGNTFLAYWCPYESNDCKLAWLGSAADFMFTAKMDGCTFAVGSAAPSGERMVAHANVGGKGAEQLDKIRGKVAFKRDQGMKTLAPSAYSFGGKDALTGTNWKIQATTFGIRLANGTWKFYCQTIKYDSTQKTMQLVAVVPIA
jgi:hypothetical protein